MSYEFSNLFEHAIHHNRSSRSTLAAHRFCCLFFSSHTWTHPRIYESLSAAFMASPMETLPFFPYSSIFLVSGTTKTMTNESAQSLNVCGSLSMEVSRSPIRSQR